MPRPSEQDELLSNVILAYLSSRGGFSADLIEFLTNSPEKQEGKFRITAEEAEEVLERYKGTTGQIAEDAVDLLYSQHETYFDA